MRRKEDFLTPILAVIAALFRFCIFQVHFPKSLTDEIRNVHLTWADNAKIDGGSIKGFAKTLQEITIYAIYKFDTEDEKQKFIAIKSSFYCLYIASGNF